MSHEHEPELFLTREELEIMNRLLWQKVDQLGDVAEQNAVIKLGEKLSTLLGEMEQGAFLELA